MTPEPADDEAGLARHFLELDDEAFSSELARSTFEVLSATARGIAQLVDDGAVGLDALARTVRRARSILAECDRRIRAVEAELTSDVDDEEPF